MILPTPLKAEQATELAEDYVNGNLSLRNPLIEGHLLLAKHIANKYAGRGDRFDLVSTAFLCVIEAVDVFPSIYVDYHISKYINVKVRYGCLKERSRARSLIYVPHTTRERHKDTTQDDVLVDYRMVAAQAESKPPLSLEMRELLDIACKDNRDRQILNLKICGFTDKEIAEHLGVHLSGVAARKSKVYERLRRLLL